MPDKTMTSPVPGTTVDPFDGGLVVEAESTNCLAGRLTVYVTQYGDLALCAEGGDCSTGPDDEPAEVTLTLTPEATDALKAALGHVQAHGVYNPLRRIHYRVGESWVCARCGEGSVHVREVVEIDGEKVHRGCLRPSRG